MKRIIIAILIAISFITFLHHIGLFSPKKILIDELVVERPNYFYMSSKNDVLLQRDNYLCYFNTGCHKKYRFKEKDYMLSMIFESIFGDNLFVSITKNNESHIPIKEKVFGKYDVNIKDCKVKYSTEDYFSYDIMQGIYSITMNSNKKELLEDALDILCSRP